MSKKKLVTETINPESVNRADLYSIKGGLRFTALPDEAGNPAVVKVKGYTGSPTTGFRIR